MSEDRTTVKLPLVGPALPDWDEALQQGLIQPMTGLVDVVNTFSMSGQIQEALQAHSNMFAFLPENVIDNFRKALEPIQEMTKELGHSDEVFLQSGWWFSPIIMELPAPGLVRAMKLYRSGKPEAMSQYMVTFFNKKDHYALSVMVKAWKEDIYFNVWHEPITQALYAHRHKKYHLSVPALLIVIEGIAGQICKDFGVEVRSDQSALKVKQAISTLHEKNEYSETLNTDIILALIDSKIFQRTRNVKGARGYRHYLNRHAIMHGATPHYGTAKNSLQCFLLLDLLLKSSE